MTGLKEIMRQEKKKWNQSSPDPAKNARQAARKPPTNRRSRLNDDYPKIPVEPPKNGKTTHPHHNVRPAKPAKNQSKTTNQGPRPNTSKPSSGSDGVERRARRYRDHAPQTFLERIRRIRFQRMFVVGHTVNGLLSENPEISFDIVGSTGNMYKTTIRKEPTCDCPDGKSGNQCKHICYALVYVLKAPGELQYQLAFLTSELRTIWQSSPLSRRQSAPIDLVDGVRKPIEGDCAICFMELQPSEDIVWCKSACGNNIHKACFAQWAATTQKSGAGVRCVYCRTTWKEEPPNLDIETIRQSGNVGDDGYLNVASQFGLSTQRDYSVYSPFSTARPSYYSGPRQYASSNYYY
ncbi:RING finger domain protein [Penicillium tannophilum]|nr:RING finger domain protein [Penicillium tannophilum]